MDHDDHVNLIRDGVPEPGGRWADLGSGSGAFTMALADLLGPDGVIYSIDRDAGALRRQRQLIEVRFPQTAVHYVVADYTRMPDLSPRLPLLDGVVMANALHFQPTAEKAVVLDLVRGCLRPGGRLILVEYSTDRGNRWVPHPLSFPAWVRLAAEHGFSDTRLLATRPSRFLGEIYSALSLASG